MRFKELRLAEPILRAVAAVGYTTPTPIQTKAIPVVIDGRDVLGCAQTGTGKTGAFAMPILHRLANSTAPTQSNSGPESRKRRGPRAGRPRALVLCPTRELATQIYESFSAYGRNLHLRHAVIFGGVSQARQVRELRAGIDVLVATPGRLLDLMDQGLVDLYGIEVLVLDEADRMLDMGFIRDIKKIMERMPRKRQTLLFSATMPGEIRRLADTILHEPVSMKVAPVASTAESITQSVYRVDKMNKPTLLARLLSRHPMERTLVFTRTKYGADKLVKVLRRSGIDAGAIHGNKSQNARTRALDGFKSGDMPVLIATDIASRGIDVDEITHVVNFDIPNIPETYVHRIGRTARAGASGTAFSFCDREEVADLRAIERLIRMELEIIEDGPDLVFENNQSPGGNGGRNGSGNGTSRTPRGQGSPSARSSGGRKSTPPKTGARKSGARQSRNPAARNSAEPSPRSGRGRARSKPGSGAGKSAVPGLKKSRRRSNKPKLSATGR